MTVIIQKALTWRDVANVAAGEALALSPAAAERIFRAREIVEALVDSGQPAYGITTGVGALSETVVDRSAQSRLSRSIVLSHACGVGPLLARREVRAVIAAQIGNFAHGFSGIRPLVVEHLLRFLAEDCVPDMPSRGSAGYLTHNAHTALVLIGEGGATVGGRHMSGRAALEEIGLLPLTLAAKEGLSLVNGTACATGLFSLALARTERLLDWADAVAAMTIEAAGGQMSAFAEAVLALRPSQGIARTGARLRARLAGSERIAEAAGRRLQDALSLRAVPHAHGAAFEAFLEAGRVVDLELASVTDNPAICGTVEAPLVWSQAHAVAPALGQAADALAIAVAQISAMSERRMDRLVNPLVNGPPVSPQPAAGPEGDGLPGTGHPEMGQPGKRQTDRGLPPFLASDAGSHSGLMIAQYTAAALVNDNRRLAAPASTDGGLTSALQEDFLAHPTAAAGKLLAILDNAEHILAIELMAAAQAQDLCRSQAGPAAGTKAVRDLLRRHVPIYADDRPLGADIVLIRHLIAATPPPAVADAGSSA